MALANMFVILNIPSSDFFTDILKATQDNIQVAYVAAAAFLLLVIRVLFNLIWRTFLAGFFVWLMSKLRWKNFWEILLGFLYVAGAITTIVYQVLEINHLIAAG
jgi:hypothetical protein